MSVTAPSGECEPPPRRFWSTTSAMLRFSIASASGVWPEPGKEPGIVVHVPCGAKTVLSTSSSVENRGHISTSILLCQALYRAILHTFEHVFQNCCLLL